jgi:hypothetical protein
MANKAVLAAIAGTAAKGAAKTRWSAAVKRIPGALAFPECDQDEDYREDGQTQVSQGCARLRQQVVGLGFRRHDTGECG